MWEVLVRTIKTISSDYYNNVWAFKVVIINYHSKYLHQVYMMLSFVVNINYHAHVQLQRQFKFSVISLLRDGYMYFYSTKLKRKIHVYVCECIDFLKCEQIRFIKIFVWEILKTSNFLQNTNCIKINLFVRE